MSNLWGLNEETDDFNVDYEIQRSNSQRNTRSNQNNNNSSFTSNSTNTSVNQHRGGIHDEFLQLVRDTGMENIAKEAGLISQSGNGLEIPALREYDMSNQEIDSNIIQQSMTYTTVDTTGQQDLESEQEPVSPHKRRKVNPPTDAVPPASINVAATSPNISVSVNMQGAALETEIAASPETGKKKQAKRGPRSTEEKFSKGLRGFSVRVCEKVEKKKVTTYNQVADELVAELNANPEKLGLGGSVDQKNIRRRVYDALNVLMAMGIITKEKKDIKWVGLPTNAKNDLMTLELERNARMERIRKKKSDFLELLSQQIAYRNLLSRNSKPQYANLESRIFLPFIIVNTKNTTVIECEVADDRSAYFFNFSLPFEIHDDSEILKRMGLMQQAPLSIQEDYSTMLPDTDQPMESLPIQTSILTEYQDNNNNDMHLHETNDVKHSTG
mmetsp:Transcript_7727/g.10668  ORF Transcript_7727/g.10668 Transcript_7727/m.10668 type:complete len:442 (+) Transcript_7727:100-1425(+)